MDLAATNGNKVLADRNQVEALFIILFSNALDAIAIDGKISVHSCRPGPDRIEVAIADNGCGIAPDDLPKIFLPFFSTKPPGKGTGLGLALAGSILQEHGGSICIDSAPRNGATVRVELPIWRVTATDSGGTK